MHELRLDSVVERISEAIREGNLNLADQLLYPALDQKTDVGPLWFYAGILNSMRGCQAIAFECFRRSQELEPHPANWANLGGVLRSMGRVEEARRVLARGLDSAMEHAEVYANLAGTYVNEGMPAQGIEYGEKALALKPDHAGARFNLSLLYLEAGRYGEGFDAYAEGAHRHRVEKHYDPDPPDLTPELHQQHRDQGKKLIVWAEQGIGDELMFSTILADARRDYEIVFECHARLETMFRHASWARSGGYPITMFPTRKVGGDERVSGAGADFKIAIGNLGRLYRRAREDFRWSGPVYTADPREVRETRKHLQALAGDRRIIGVALRGGTLSTARTYRMLPPAVLEDLFSDPRYLFVSLDYEDVTALGEHITQKYGPGRFVWFPSIVWHWDYAHTAALVKATDATVTVCQSVAHLSAGMGHPTYVMTPSRPAWRYGLSGDQWYWYPHPQARLLRQEASDWRPAATVLVNSLGARFFREAA